MFFVRAINDFNSEQVLRRNSSISEEVRVILKHNPTARLSPSSVKTKGAFCSKYSARNCNFKTRSDLTIRLEKNQFLIIKDIGGFLAFKNFIEFVFEPEHLLLAPIA